MILERRAYTPRPGKARLFIEAQERSGYPDTPISANKLCYFNAVSGPKDQIVHYWAYPNLNDWQSKYALLYSSERVQQYLQMVRPLFLSQGYEFFVPAPIGELCPHFSDEKRWTVGSPPLARLKDRPNLIVEEQVIGLNPGTMPAYWEAYREHGLAATAGLSDHLIGVFRTLLGTQYQVLTLRWHEDLPQMKASRDALAQNADWRSFEETIAPLVREQHTQLLAPWPVPQMSPIFYEMTG